jgi:integrase
LAFGAPASAPHRLDHTAVRGTVEPMRVVSQRLGHASPVVTMTIYAHVLPETS